VDNYDLIDNDKLDAYLIEKTISLECKLCDDGKLEVFRDATLFMPCLDERLSVVSNGKGMIVIAFVCKHCGHTVFINALANDLLKIQYIKRLEVESDVD